MHTKIKSVFISYCRKDLNEVKVLVNILSIAGIPIWQDINSLEAGMTEDQIRKAIKEECSSLVFYVTQHSVKSSFIKVVELGEAYKKSRSDETFSIFPVFRIPVDEANKNLGGELLGDISRFNGVIVEEDHDLPAKAKIVRKQLLKIILNQGTDQNTRIALMTYQPTPGDLQPLLNLDWYSLDFPDGLFSQKTWVKSIRPALLDIKDALLGIGRSQLEIFTKAHLQVGLAFGYIFRKETGFLLNIHQFNQIWPAQINKSPTSYLTCDLIEGSVGQKDLAITISITQVVEQGLKAFFHENNIFRAILNCTPASGEIPYKIPYGSVASAIAEEIRLAIVNARKTYNTTEIHIFAAIPLALAYMIGWRLNAYGRIHLYDYDKNNNEYKPTWIIDAHD